MEEQMSSIDLGMDFQMPKNQLNLFNYFKPEFKEQKII